MRVGILAVLLVGMLQATQVPTMSLEQVVDQAEVIAEGRVVRSWSGWDAAHRYVWTHYEVEVDGVLAGAAGRRMVLSEPGGEADGVRMVVSGAVPYGMGEAVMVFAYRTPVGFWRTVGWQQGKYTRVGDAFVQGGQALGAAEFRIRVREAATRRGERSRP